MKAPRRSPEHPRTQTPWSWRSRGFLSGLLISSSALTLVAILAYKATQPTSAVPVGAIPAPNLVSGEALVSFGPTVMAYSDTTTTASEGIEVSECELIPHLEAATELSPVNAADGRLMYDQARSAFFLDQDRIVVVARSALAVFDGAGSALTTIGRAGQGPGEFRSLAGAWPGEDGEIIAVDSQGWRTTTFRDDGTIVAEGTIAGAGIRGWQVRKPLGAGHWLFTVRSAAGSAEPDEPGTVIPELHLLALRGGVADTLLALEGQPRYEDLSWFASDGYMFSAPLPFEYASGFALLASRDRLLVSNGREPTVTILDLESGETVGRVPVSPTVHPISTAERREWEARYLTGPEEMRRRTEGILDRISDPPSRPPHYGPGIQWDEARSRLWVPEYRSHIPWADTLRITLAPLDGGEEARIRFPGMASVLDVSEDAALLLHRSELDEETVVRVPLTCR